MIEIGDLIEWHLPDMVAPDLGVVLTSGDKAVEVLWIATGSISWVKPEHCKVAR